MITNQKYIPKNDLESNLMRYSSNTWNWEYICYNLLISEDFLENILDINKWSFYALSRNQGLSSKFIQKYIERDWDIIFLLELPCMDSELISFMIDKRPDWIEHLQRSPLLCMNSIRKLNKSPNKQFYSDISGNPNLHPKFIEENIDKKWMWSALSRNSHLTYDFLKTYIDKPWCVLILARNPNLNIEWILLLNNHLVLPGDFWIFVSEHPNINTTDFDNYPHLPFSWNGFS
ncbi:unnamed protein product, partial [marine sediment metagenome]